MLNLTALLMLALSLIPAAAAPAGDGDVERAKLLRRQGQPTEAAGLLAEHLAAHPADADAAGLAGLCLADAGDLAGAAALSRRHGTADYRLGVLAGRLALEEGRTSDAIQLLDAAVATRERPVEGLVCLLTALEQAERWVPGVERAQQLETLVPGLGRQWGARMACSQGDRIMERAARNAEALPRAVDAYRAAWEQDPSLPGLGDKLLSALVGLARVEEAGALLPSVHPPETHRLEHRLNHGRIRAAALDHAAAEAAFRDVLAWHPGHRGASVELARARLVADDAEAVVALLTPLSAAPIDPEVELLLGRAQELAQRWTSAERHFQRVLEAVPDHTEALYRLSRVAMRLGKRDEARRLVALSHGR